MILGLFWTLEPCSYESVTDIANHQIEVLENGRRGREVVIIHLCNGQAEIDELVVAAIETRQRQRPVGRTASWALTIIW